MLAYLKAIIAAIIAALSALATALQDNHVTALEWVTVASAFFIALGGVSITPWLPDKNGKHEK